MKNVIDSSCGRVRSITLLVKVCIIELDLPYNGRYRSGTWKKKDEKCNFSSDCREPGHRRNIVIIVFTLCVLSRWVASNGVVLRSGPSSLMAKNDYIVKNNQYFSICLMQLLMTFSNIHILYCVNYYQEIILIESKQCNYLRIRQMM